ncbi:hypothetical protein [Streptomyces sp. NPDC059247]
MTHYDGDIWAELREDGHLHDARVEAEDAAQAAAAPLESIYEYEENDDEG